MKDKYKIPCVYEDEASQYYMANELAEIAKVLRVKTILKALELKDKNSQSMDEINSLMEELEYKQK